MASVFVLLEAFNRKEAAALGFFPCATASYKSFLTVCILIVRLFDQPDLLPDLKRLAAKMELQSGDRDKCFHREPPVICINCCVTNPTRP